MFRAAIVEDSETDRRALQGHLDRYAKESDFALAVDAYDRAETFLGSYKPVYDVVFLDIMLPYMNGMDAAEQLRRLDDKVPLIFVTDMAQYALRGYKVGALDYFLKPVSYYDLKLRMDKMRLAAGSRRPPIIIHIPGEGDLVVTSEELKYIEIMDKQLTYHTTKGEYSARGQGLKKLESELSGHGFCRCSSSYLVNLRWCREVTGDEVVVDGERLKISRGMKKEFVTRLADVLVGTADACGGGCR